MAKVHTHIRRRGLRGAQAGGTPTSGYSREFTDSSGDEDIDLSTIGPAEVGSASYVLSGSPAGVSLLSDILTIDTDVAIAGNISVTRTDDTGDRILSLQLTLVEATVDIVDDTGEVTYGTNTRTDATITIVFTAGVYNGRQFSYTPAEIQAVPDGQGLAVLPSLIGLSTDTGQANELDPDDVATISSPALWIYESGATPPTITQTGWYDQTTLLQAGNGDYTGENPATEDTSIFHRTSDGTSNSDSDVILVATSFTSTDLFGVGDDGMLVEAANSTAWTDTKNGTVASDGQAIAFIEDLSGNDNDVEGDNSVERSDASGVKYFNLSNTNNEFFHVNGPMGWVATEPRTCLFMLRTEPPAGSRFTHGENAHGTIAGGSIRLDWGDDGSVEWRVGDNDQLQSFSGATTGLDIKTGPRIIGYRSKLGVASIDNAEDFELYCDGTYVALSSSAATLNPLDDDHRIGRYRGTYSISADVCCWISINRHLTDAEIVSLSNEWKGLA